MGTKEQTNLVRRLFHRDKPAKTWLGRILKLIAWLPVVFIALSASLFVVDRWISYQARHQVFTQPEQIEQFDVAVVLVLVVPKPETEPEYELGREPEKSRGFLRTGCSKIVDKQENL